MARIRTIKPEFWSHAQIIECSPNARLLLIGLLNFCDDSGRHPLAYKTMKAEVFPADDIPLDDIRRMFGELESNGLVSSYSVDNKDYFYVPGWHHQKIDRPQPPKYPEPSESNRRTVAECSPLEGKGRDKDKETMSAAAEPQTDGAKGKKEAKSKNQYTDEFEQAWKEYQPPRNASKFKAWVAWDSAKRIRPPFEKMLEAIRGYNRWLKEESTRRKSTYPKQHMATWIRGRMWEGYLAQGSEADTKAQVEKSEKQWNGFARPFANIVGDGSFVAWFANTKVKEGKPNTLLVENEFRRTEVERRFTKELQQVLGKDVRIEVGK